ncbi:SsgA family sporulation/cell division regulator [Streptomyces sp. NPDC021093]|uniref:SsgA family sporulation/cell division regulator n=1 Tax=Streptomyces sp. NPDC021093 TaxID=3365112 RepID=UPI00379429AC
MSRTVESPQNATSEALTAIEMELRAGLITDAPAPVCLPVTLRHDPARDARAVSVVLPSPGPSPDRQVWTFPRALLEAGLRAPAEQHDVRIWPCGRVQAVLELQAPQGVVLLQLDCAPLVRFLRRTYA